MALWQKEVISQVACDSEESNNLPFPVGSQSNIFLCPSSAANLK